MPRGGWPRLADDDPRRCPRIKADGLRCTQYKMRGAGYCRFHGGRFKGRKLGRTRIAMADKHFYSSVLGSTLKERFEKAMDKDEEEQLELTEEVAVSRALAATNIAILEAALESDSVDAHTKAAALAQVRGSLDHVAGLVERADRMRKRDGNHFHANQVATIVDQMCAIVHGMLSREEAEKLEQALRENVVIPDTETLRITVVDMQD